MTKLYYIDVEKLPENALERMCANLSAERKEKVKSQKCERDKLLSAAAGYILEQALKSEGVASFSLCYNQNGKPYLRDGKVYFNLSHSGSVAVCAVSDREVGVDVQAFRPVKDELLKKVCTQAEYSFVTADGGEILQRFCRVWALKESVMKCLGKGLSLSPKKIEMDFSSKTCAKIDGKDSKLYFKEYGLNGYCIAVCCQLNAFAPDMIKVSL
ncbi:MAG: 4'-phosphopantetheinyl transferase family protein [Candidatus Coproplasma sp.]